MRPGGAAYSIGGAQQSECRPGGPLNIFAGSTRMRTEALPTTVFLELQAGNLPGMLAVSIIMIVLAAGILIAARLFGLRRLNR